MYPEEMKEIIENVDISWSKDHIIRYFYVKLAPFFRRDLKYFLASDKEKEEEYKKGFVNRGLDIVCSTLADFYVELFQTFGIKAKKIAANSAKIPLFAVIVEGDHGWFFIDPINDLFHNQYGLKTTEFGVIPHYNTLKQYSFLNILPKDYVNEMDAKLGFQKTLDDYFDQLHIQMTDRNFTRNLFNISDIARDDLFQCKMQFSNEQLINLGNVSGPFERIQLYLFLERVLFYKTEKKNLKIWLNQDYDIPRPSIEYKNPTIDSSVLYEEEMENGKFVLKRKK